MPQLTVITAVKNLERTIEQCIKSVINLKTDGELEFIVVDGNSTDATPSILHSYRQRIDILIEEPDVGLYDALNKGLRAAHGKYVFFLGGDDELLWIPDNYDADIICGDVIFSNGYRFAHPVERTLRQRMRYRNSIHPQGTFYRRVGCTYDIRYKICADYMFNLIMLERCFSISVIHKIVSRFSTKGISSGSMKAKQELTKIAFQQMGTFWGCVAFFYNYFDYLRYTLSPRRIRDGLFPNIQ